MVFGTVFAPSHPFSHSLIFVCSQNTWTHTHTHTHRWRTFMRKYAFRLETYVYLALPFWPDFFPCVFTFYVHGIVCLTCNFAISIHNKIGKQENQPQVCPSPFATVKPIKKMETREEQQREGWNESGSRDWPNWCWFVKRKCDSNRSNRRKKKPTHKFMDISFVIFFSRRIFFGCPSPDTPSLECKMRFFFELSCARRPTYCSL